MTRLMLRVAPLALVVSALPALASTWEADPQHSAATFSVRHMMITNVKGEFGKLTSTLELNEADLTRSSVKASIDVSTINTRIAKRDAHLKSPDFFDAARYPTMDFVSTRVERLSDQKLKVTGDLSMHGVTKPVVLDVELTPEAKDPMGGVRRGVSATTRINRTDWGLKWNKPLETGGVLVGDEVQISLDMSYVKQPAKKARR